MHYIFYLWMDQFYVSQAPADHKSPIVVTHEGVTVDVNDAAIQAQLELGMKVSAAKSICPKAAFFEMSQLKLETTWWDGVIEYVDGLEPLAPHAAMADFSGHASPFEFAESLCARYPRLCIGIGPNRWMAESALPPRGWREISTQVPLFLATCPISRFSVATIGEKERLYWLGYETVGELQSVGLAQLTKQFDRRGLELHRAARGFGDAKVSASYPPDSVSARQFFSGGLSDRQILENGLVKLSAELGQLLREKDAQAKWVDVIFELDQSPPFTVGRNFSKHLHSPGGLLSGLALMTRELPDGEIVGIRVRLREMHKSSRVQQSLHSINAKTERNSSVVHALSLVKSTFGENVILLGSEIEEPRRKRVLRAWKDATGWA